MIVAQFAKDFTQQKSPEIFQSFGLAVLADFKTA